jgi:hypothetical protein
MRETQCAGRRFDECDVIFCDIQEVPDLCGFSDSALFAPKRFSGAHVIGKFARRHALSGPLESKTAWGKNFSRLGPCERPEHPNRARIARITCK